MSSTYDILPRIKTFPIGTIFKAKYDIYGSIVTEANEQDFELEDFLIPVDSILTFVDDRQFMASTKLYSMSAHVRFKFVVNEKYVWVTICREVARIWNFETYTGKRNKILKNINDMFEILPLK